MAKARNIILCGFMGTGKTTVGKLVAARLGWQFADTDQVIEERCGKPVSAIFAEDGEAAFRAMERELCNQIAASWRGYVIATGGGMVLDAANRQQLMRAGCLICLDLPAEHLARRLAGKTDRPLLADPPNGDLTAHIQALLAARAESYRAVPHHINTTGLSPYSVSEAILEIWRR
ncbi:MAG: shikimate kinase [Aggregatilineales bacterium]